jgi:hypothetical protein
MIGNPIARGDLETIKVLMYHTGGGRGTVVAFEIFSWHLLIWKQTDSQRSWKSSAHVPRKLCTLALVSNEARPRLAVVSFETKAGFILLVRSRG